MSIRDTTSVPFEIATSPQNLRLLELPPSLLELIRSSHPLSLTLKSSATTNDGSPQAPSYAMLCTENQTYQVRQVQSSNSVFVCQPTKTQPPSSSSHLSVTTLSAIAQCPSLLELIPTSPHSVAYLKRMLAIYTVDEADAMDLDHTANKDYRSLLEDVPFSAREFRDAWQEVCAFPSEGKAWLPAAQSLANIWRSITSAAALRSIDLGEPFAISDLVGTIEEDGHPKELLMAVLARLRPSDFDQVDDLTYARIDGEKCVAWVGAVLLESHTGEMMVSDFMKDWQDQVPEGWRKMASLGLLKNRFSRPTKKTIVSNENVLAGDLTATAIPKTTAAAKAKPNWHEKFRNANR